jgi:hypothetical protein
VSSTEGGRGLSTATATRRHQRIFNHACVALETPPCTRAQLLACRALPLLPGGGASATGEGGGPTRAHRTAHQRTAAAWVGDFEQEATAARHTDLRIEKAQWSCGADRTRKDELCPVVLRLAGIVPGSKYLKALDLLACRYVHACSRHVDVLSHPPEQESRQPEAHLPPPVAHGSRNLIGVDGAEYAPLELVWQGTAGLGAMLLTLVVVGCSLGQ